MNGFGNFIFPFEFEAHALGLGLYQQAEIVEVGHGEVPWPLISAIGGKRGADKIADAHEAMFQKSN